MSFVLSNYLNSEFEYVFFASVVLTDPGIRENILKQITATGYEILGFTLTCSEQTLTHRHDQRGDEGQTNFHWLHLPACAGDVVVNTDNKTVREVARELKGYIDGQEMMRP